MTRASPPLWSPDRPAPTAGDETSIKAESSANSQFFIFFQPKLQRDNVYTVFGRVIGGMQYVDAIHRGEPPADPSRILHAYIAADNPPPYQPAPAVDNRHIVKAPMVGTFYRSRSEEHTLNSSH